MRALPDAGLACPEPERWEKLLRRHASLDFFDYETVDVGDSHPQLLEVVARRQQSDDGRGE